MDDTGDRGGSSGGDGSENSRRKSHYQRYTAQQIERLEGSFNECPHPDGEVRMQLGIELGLTPRQIQFWFQNRRTQFKAQHEKAENSVLRAENDKIRYENIAMVEALKNAVCASCRGPDHFDGDINSTEQKLREENAHLRGELKRHENIVAKFTGRPLSQLHLGQQLQLSSLDLSMASFGKNGMTGSSSLNLDLLSGSSSTFQTLPFRRISLTDMDKLLMFDVSRNAMEELIKLLQSNSPFWIRSSADGHEVLNPEVYESIFPGVAKSPNVRIESSKDSSVVIINSCLDLVDMFMDANKWMGFFPNIVSRATIVEVISSGLMGSRNGLLQLMYEELQVLSPLVPTREFYFLRLCQQIEQNAWAIVDVSYDFSQGPFSNSQSPVRRLPSGCLIQDMLNGHSKITWMEHMEIEDLRPIHNLYLRHICSGIAFGATRKLATLQRTCERLTCFMDASNISDLGGVITSPRGKRSLMKLSQRMVKTFCSSINIVNGQQLMIYRVNDAEVHTTLQKCTDPGHPNSMVLSAATTIAVPFGSVKIFDLLRDERSRPLWDVLSNHILVKEVGHIACGSHPGNCISVLRADDTSQSNMLILQESCIDSSGALVVYCPIDLHTINIAMSCEDPSFIPILSSGFAISPDAGENLGPGETSAGSLVTMVVQIIVSNLTSGKMNRESVDTVNNLVGKTLQQIKAALNSSLIPCTDS